MIHRIENEEEGVLPLLPISKIEKRNWSFQYGVFSILVLTGVLVGCMSFREMDPSSNTNTRAVYLRQEDNAKLGGFQQYLERVSWDEWEMAIRNGDRDAVREYTTQVIAGLGKFAALEPKVPINATCSQPPPLPEPEIIDCAAYPTAFTGVKRSKPAKVAHLIQLGFDIDVLEIHLREIADVVDYFFVLESTRAQYKLVRKPLMWEAVRDQERFRPFADKVIHLIVDDAEGTPDGRKGEDIWFLEGVQEDRRWRKFLEWNAKTKHFSEEDVVGFGDTDEIAHRNNLQLLKHCQILGPVDIGIWFPFGLLTQAFRTDWPVRGHPFTLGDPTYWPLKAAMSLPNGKAPNRQRGTSGRYLLGGMHMTNHRYLPFLLLKLFTCTECGISNPNKIRTMAELARAGNTTAMEMKYGDEASGAEFQNRISQVEEVKQQLRGIAVLPWFYECNRDRYPYWEKRHDSRVE